MKVNASLLNKNNTGWLKSPEWRQRPQKWSDFARFRSTSASSTNERSTRDSSRRLLLKKN